MTRARWKPVAMTSFGGYPGGAVVKNRLASTGDTRDMGSVPGLGRSPGEGNGNPP